MSIIDEYKDNRIALIKDDEFDYPSNEYMYSPSEHYPEYPFNEYALKPNAAYDKVRSLFHALGFDDEHYGTTAWNPLGEFINPGDKILIKPNWVMHYNKNEDGGTDCLVTHPSLIRAVIDYVYIATKGNGRIVVADAPMAECDYSALQEEMHFNDIWKFYSEKDIRIITADLRNSIVINGKRIKQREPDSGILVDLGKESIYEELSDKQIDNFVMVSGTYPNNIKNFHHRGTHKYLINNYVLESNVIINMPKVKTHRRTAITACSKNFVGICSLKDCLPHSIYGGVDHGGCEYPDSNFFSGIYSVFKKYQFKKSWFTENTKKVRYILSRLSKRLSPNNREHWDGMWYGNDAVWRFIVDLNEVIRFADEKGKLHGEQQRVIFNICDAIVAGEKNGPISPSPKELGAVIGGFNGIAIDYFIADIMGFDYQNIRYIPTIIQRHHVDIDNLQVIAENGKKTPIQSFVVPAEWHFMPTSGWKDYIEKK